MKLKNLYQEIVKKGIEGDIRSRNQIDELSKANKKTYDSLSSKEKAVFDTDVFFNPYADTRLLNGDDSADIQSVIVGVDLEVQELLVMDRLNQKGEKIDLAIAHHPEGRAYGQFWDVMDVQADIFVQKGISISASDGLLSERKSQVERRVHAANHCRSSDVAKLLGLNYLCMHTPCDNWANNFLSSQLKKHKPKNLGVIMDMLLDIPEYNAAAKSNNAPIIAIGSKKSRCANIHLEFTGGTEGPKDIYSKLASQGVDTIIAMHQSEEHYKKCLEAKINVIFASHIASDNIGINIMLDHLESKNKKKFKTYELSGFRRFRRKK